MNATSRQTPTLPTTVDELVAQVIAARIPGPVRLQFGPHIPGHEVMHTILLGLEHVHVHVRSVVSVEL